MPDPEGLLPLLVPFPDPDELPMFPEWPIPLPLHVSEIMSTFVTLKVFSDVPAFPEAVDDIPLLPLSHVPFTATS